MGKAREVVARKRNSPLNVILRAVAVPRGSLPEQRGPKDLSCSTCGTLTCTAPSAHRTLGAPHPRRTAHLPRTAHLHLQRTAHRTCDAPQVRCRWVRCRWVRGTACEAQLVRRRPSRPGGPGLRGPNGVQVSASMSSHRARRSEYGLRMTLGSDGNPRAKRAIRLGPAARVGERAGDGKSPDYARSTQRCRRLAV